MLGAQGPRRPHPAVRARGGSRQRRARRGAPTRRDGRREARGDGLRHRRGAEPRSSDRRDRDGRVAPSREGRGRPGQRDRGALAAGKAGALEDPAYIAGLRGAAAPAGGQNVAVLSISATASILAQYVSLNVAPGGIGEPGPLQYVLSTHTLE